MRPMSDPGVAGKPRVPAHLPGTPVRPSHPARRWAYVPAAALALVATGLAYSPAWAAGSGGHHGRPFPGPPTTTPAATTTTTAAAQMPAPAAPPPLAEDTCVKGAWEPQVAGRPTAFLLAGDAAYLWHDADGGWALRVTDPGAQVRVVFSGFLASATGQFTDVSSMASGNDDIVYETANKHTIFFRFVNFGVLDGLNFGTDCARAFTVNIHARGRLLPANDVFLGSGTVSPYTNPFKVERVRLMGALP